MEMREMISHNLLRLRKERGMSQEEVAFLCKMSVRTYGKIQRGDANFEIDTLDKILKGLGITRMEFAEESQDEQIS